MTPTEQCRATRLPILIAFALTSAACGGDSVVTGTPPAGPPTHHALVSGTVVDTAGNRLEGVIVSAETGSGANIAGGPGGNSTITDQSGSYFLEVNGSPPDTLAPSARATIVLRAMLRGRPAAVTDSVRIELELVPLPAPPDTVSSPELVLPVPANFTRLD